MARQITPENKYADRLVKLIPAEIISAYVAIASAIPASGADSLTITWIVFAILFVLVPLYLRLLLHVESWLQIIASMVSFIVWTISVGGLGSHYDFWEGYYNSILIVLWAVILPLFRYDERGKLRELKSSPKATIPAHEPQV